MKFTFTAYTVLIGAALGLYQFGLKEQIDITSPVSAVLIVGTLLGLFMFVLVIRNRVYFVKIARYLNEQRGLFFKQNPLGFENIAQMETDPKQPLFFHWRSTHLWLSYTMALMNAILLGVLLFIAVPYNCWKWYIIVFVSLILLIIQVFSAILYLYSHEKK